MRKFFILFVSSILLLSSAYAAKSKRIIRGRGGMVIKIGHDVLGIGTEGRVIGINTAKRIIDVQVISIDRKVTVEKIPAAELQVLQSARLEYVDSGGIEKIKKNSKVLSFLGESRVVKIYKNNLIRIKSLKSKKIEKVVNANDVQVLIPTKRGVKGWNNEFTIRKGNLVTYNGDAEVLMTYKYSKAKIKCLSTGEIKIVPSQELSINKGLDKIEISRNLGSDKNNKESIEDLF